MYRARRLPTRFFFQIQQGSIGYFSIGNGECLPGFLKHPKVLGSINTSSRPQ